MREFDATLVGEDTQGNKYYEKKENVQFGRHRWVVYADQSNYNASAVPPEWHAWLHHISDHTAEELMKLKPTRYGVAHKENLTGRGDGMIHMTKGHALNPNKRDWKRYQSWQPENPEGSEKKSSATNPNSTQLNQSIETFPLEFSENCSFGDGGNSSCLEMEFAMEQF